eukprot:m.94765 g.94765  ORF g.94765 m.94765 type:complete len:151 (+) comp36828_c0_seq7:2814-3266(+)
MGRISFSIGLKTAPRRLFRLSVCLLACLGLVLVDVDSAVHPRPVIQGASEGGRRSPHTVVMTANDGGQGLAPGSEGKGAAQRIMEFERKLFCMVHMKITLGSISLVGAVEVESRLFLQRLLEIFHMDHLLVVELGHKWIKKTTTRLVMTL